MLNTLTPRLSGVKNTNLIFFFILLFLFVRHCDAVSNYYKFAQELRMEKMGDGHEQKKLESFVTDYSPTILFLFGLQSVNNIYDAYRKSGILVCWKVHVIARVWRSER